MLKSCNLSYSVAAEVWFSVFFSFIIVNAIKLSIIRLDDFQQQKWKSNQRKYDRIKRLLIYLNWNLNFMTLKWSLIDRCILSEIDKWNQIWRPFLRDFWRSRQSDEIWIMHAKHEIMNVIFLWFISRFYMHSVNLSGAEQRPWQQKNPATSVNVLGHREFFWHI